MKRRGNYLETSDGPLASRSRLGWKARSFSRHSGGGGVHTNDFHGGGVAKKQQWVLFYGARLWKGVGTRKKRVGYKLGPLPTVLTAINEERSQRAMGENLQKNLAVP